MAKNSEVYKTANERAEAFRRFCQPNACHDCQKCKVYGNGKGSLVDCVYQWLDIEAEEEKPQESFEDLLKEVREFADSFIVNGEDKGLENPCDTLHEIADRFEAAHNRVAKAVRESESSSDAKGDK